MAVDKMEVDKKKLEEEFYKIVLSWDYFRLKKSSKPIGRDDNSTTSGLQNCLVKVKDTYKDVEDYIATFTPLLFEEVKAQITQGKEEEEEVKEEEVKAQITQGKEEEKEVKEEEVKAQITQGKEVEEEVKEEDIHGLTIECSELHGFLFTTVMCRSTESVSQNDLLLVSNEKFSHDDPPEVYGFALLEYRQPDKIRLRFNLSGEIQAFNTAEVQLPKRLRNMRPLITGVKEYVFIKKICSLSTIVREYLGLQSIRSLPFKDLILSGADKNITTEDFAWEIPKPLKEYIHTNHNTSQIEAINAGLSGKNFILIQGPPGTGKTQTILGLLSALLHASPARLQSSRVKLKVRNCGPELPLHDKYMYWEKASPWLAGINSRDEIKPVDGDDGFFPTSGNDLKPEMVNTFRKYRVRVLVCAPSNSALDEIVLRILNTGIRDENDRAYTPKIVRIGLKAHHSVKAVSMDYLVEQKLMGMELISGEKQKQGGALMDKDSIRTSILEESVIVFSTLSFSGSSMFSKLNHGFDVVIIDEAAQAVEPATLVPLSNGCKQVILVGDPVQLPATVISQVATDLGYNVSLFQRLQKAGYPVQMLKTQYRMHPEIRIFPAKEFYYDGLEDGPDILEQTRRTWHDYRCFGPFSFFDITESAESPSGSGSWDNVSEVEFVLALYHKLVSGYPELKSSSRVAIISPYRHQVKLLRKKFNETFGSGYDKVVDINTIDGFQGREKDLAIFSCVRSSDKNIGFLGDFRRMNVAITRARSSVLVVGNASKLRSHETPNHWKNLIESAEGRNTLFTVSKPYTNFFSDMNLKSMEVGKSMPEGHVSAVVNAEAFASVDNANVVEDTQIEMPDWGHAADGDEGLDED